jgi:aldose 1-epimerase
LSGTLELGDGRWKLVVAAALGGSLLACEYDGIEVLKPTEQPVGSARTAMHCCCFPLVPFSNRIEKGRFSFDGMPIRLTPNVAGSPHAMHGHGWQSAWQVVEHGETSCALEFQHEAGAGWPWAYRARQDIRIDGDAVSLTLAVENQCTGIMPGGLGFHPFLPRTRGARLAFEAACVASGTAEDFGTEPVAVPAALDFRDAPYVADREDTDHCFEGWHGFATVSGDRDSCAFRLDGCAATRRLIVYIPSGADYFCVEPVTHSVNAVNRPDALLTGLWRLESGERRAITMTIRPIPKGPAVVL